MDILLNSAVYFVLPLIIVVIVMPFFIKLLKTHSINQTASEYSLEEYKKKDKTPIMGGLLFIFVSIISLFILEKDIFYDRKILFVITSTLLFCLVGFLDDLLIIIRKDNSGLTPRIKLIMEFVFTIILFFLFKDILSPFVVEIPYLHIEINMPIILYLIFMIITFLSEANAVNFTDGMDGLCAGVSVISLIPFAIFSYINNNFLIYRLILCVIGSLIGYLFYNFHPAKIFMGDSGSLALGALFSSLAFVLNKQILLIFVGGVFVWEMLCVCIQLLSVKLFHKRVFKYTPIHYSFTINGMKEINVVLLFYFVATILSIIGTLIGIK